MAMVQCENGHNYDDRTHTHCPYCPVPGLKDVPMSRNRNDRGSDETASALNVARLRGALQERSGDMPRVFISSTFKDLEVWRQAAFEAIQSLGGVSENMIYWSADDREPSDLSISRVRSSDALAACRG